MISMKPRKQEHEESIIDINTDDYSVGAIVGRFQLADLHEAHKFLIDTVVNNHKKSIILLGVTRAIGTAENPIRIPSRENILDFQSRLYMLQEEYPNTVIVSVQDKEDDHVWSKQVDDKIREIFPTEKVLLYGGRDSFVPYYHGKFPTKCLDPKIYISATMQRNMISKEVLKDSNFRRGQIYYAYQQSPILYTNYNVVIEDNDNYLFERKNGKLKLIEGLAGINDTSFEAGARRVIKNMVGHIDTTVKYVLSRHNREFNNKTNKCVNMFFVASKISGRIDPNIELQNVSKEDITDAFILDNFEEQYYEFLYKLIK